MNCPKCNKAMKIMYRPEATDKNELREITTVLGTCRDCDFDATWSIKTIYGEPNDRVQEYGLKQYFFG